MAERGSNARGGSRGGFSNRGRGGAGDGNRGGFSGNRGGGEGGFRAGRGGYRGGSGEFRGRGGAGRGGYGGVSASMETLNLGPEPAPLEFVRPAAGDQAGYLAAAKPAPAFREGKKKVDVFTNTWQMKYADRQVFAYDVSVGLEAIGNDGSTRIVSVNKGPKDDATTFERCELIKATIKAALECYKMLSARGAHLSDGAAILYTNESLTAALKKHGEKILVPVEKLYDLFPEVRRFIRVANVTSIVIEVSGCKSFNLKDHADMATLDRRDIDQTVKQFHELLTSEYVLANHVFDFFKGGKLYRNHPEQGNSFPSAGYGQERRPGISKGVGIAAEVGAAKSVFPALNIDVTNGTFWSALNLVDTVCQINGWSSPEAAVWNARAIRLTQDMISGLRVSFTSANNSTFSFKIDDITAGSTEATDGKTTFKVTTIEDLKCTNAKGEQEPLFNKFSHVQLKHRGWPLIIYKRSRPQAGDSSPTKKFVTETQHYPMELLMVKANQRVPLNKQGANALRPVKTFERWNQTCKDLDALNLFGNTKGFPANPILNAFGVSVVRTPLKTTAYTRRMPEMTFNQPGRGAATTNVTPNDRSTFFTNRTAFVKPAHINLLHIAYSTDPRGCGVDPLNFQRIFVEAAKAKGMRIDNCTTDTVPAPKLFNQLKAISEKRTQGQNVIFIYVEPAAKNTHDELKLFERIHQVTTEHLKMENVKEANRNVIENILMKLNIKANGHNYTVNPEKFAHKLWCDKKTMIMGYDVCHPTGPSRQDRIADVLPDPSVVGFSFNGGINADSFIGDYHYQMGLRERVTDAVLNERMKWMLLTFEQSRGCLPPLIIVVRDGISDGQFQHGMDELEVLREAAQEYAVSKMRTDATGKETDPEYEPDFIFVVATKRHHKRAYTEPSKGNMPAMTALDDTITDPDMFEFYLQSHTPLQGTAKATRYIVLKDDVGTNQDAMQALMAALCFEHQVTNSAISIPEPVYQSDEWAKRGFKNMKKFKDLWNDGRGHFKKGMTHEKLTEQLAYWKCSLGKTRVNA